jgi:protein TonB
MRIDAGRFFTVSLVAHLALGAALAAVPSERRHESVAITFRDVKKAPPPPAPAPIDEPPPPTPVAHPVRAKAAPPSAPKAEPVAARAQAAPSLDALPDFGLSLGGAGGGGIAVPVARRGASDEPPARAAAKVLSRVAPRPDECSEPAAKPRPLSRPAPAYTDEARAAGVSGKVRVEITVDEQGRVVSARVLQGLGHGLDEAALAAARAMTFEPAVRCGRPSSATFKIGFTFAPPP